MVSKYSLFISVDPSAAFEKHIRFFFLLHVRLGLRRFVHEHIDRKRRW